MPRRVIGGKRRTDAEPAPVQQGWNTDKISGQDPNFAYQFMRKDEVEQRSRSTLVKDRRENPNGVPVRVQGWTPVREGEVELMGWRPDVGHAVDTTLTMGPHVLMKIPKKDHDLLLHEKDAVPDAIERRIMRGGTSGQFEDVATQVDKPFATHPALMGEQGAEDYSAKESKIMQKLGANT